MSERKCPGAGCNRTIAEKKFACRTCWHALPLSIRGPIEKARTNLIRARESQNLLRAHNAQHELRQAQNHAIDHWEAEAEVVAL